MMNKGDIDIYTSEGGTEIHVRLEQKTIWLDAHLMAELFGVQRQAVVKHIRNIFKSGEFNEKARKLAERLSLNFTGTLGMFARAKTEGLIESVKPIIEKIRRTNFRFSEEVFSAIIKAADEE